MNTVTHETVTVHPMDEHNQKLVSNAHPPEWQNPSPEGKYNAVVIGGGTGGLITAAAVSGLGGKVALIERHLMGGDCLNFGCLPSKAIIRPAAILGEFKRAAEFGIQVDGSVTADFGAIMERMRRIRAQVSPVDSVKRYTNLGVDIYLGQGTFTGTNTIEVGGQTLEFSKAVIATGARAIEIPIKGLKEAGYLTNETLFTLTELPKRFAIIGGGPIGSEMAQTFARFGSEVYLIDMAPQILIREDKDAAAIVQAAMEADGVNLVTSAKTEEVTVSETGKVIHYEQDGVAKQIEVDEILMAVGRAPNVDGLGLEVAEVKYDKRQGVKVDDYLQTSNPDIYAVGDVAMVYKFTHAADAAARIVVRNAFFKGRSKVSDLIMPWCTYTEPEIAHVGLYPHQAEEQGLELDTYTVHFEHVDRALADGDDDSMLKIHTKKGSDKILGATIVARNAGDMISEITVAMVGGIGLAKIANAIHPYPTQAEAIKRAADAYNRTRLTPTIKNVLNKWMAWLRR